MPREVDTRAFVKRLHRKLKEVKVVGKRQGLHIVFDQQLIGDGQRKHTVVQQRAIPIPDDCLISH